MQLHGFSMVLIWEKMVRIYYACLVTNYKLLLFNFIKYNKFAGCLAALLTVRLPLQPPPSQAKCLWLQIFRNVSENLMGFFFCFLFFSFLANLQIINSWTNLNKVFSTKRYIWADKIVCQVSAQCDLRQPWY